MPNTEINTCKYCGRPMKDLTQGLGIGRHNYCDRCHSHFYECTDSGLSPTRVIWSRWFTRKEWFEYINGRPERADDF